MNEIYSRELSEVMAYAEKPHRELAALAITQGMNKTAHLQENIAGIAANEAGRKYINHLGSLLLASESSKPEAESLTFTMADVQLAKGTKVNKSDFYDFACFLHPADSDHNNHVRAGGVWTLMGRVWLKTAGFHAANAPNLIQKTHPKFEVRPTAPFGTEGKNLDLSSVVELIREFDSIMSADPSLRPTEVLGRYAGEAKILFLRQFASYKLTEIKSTQKTA